MYAGVNIILQIIIGYILADIVSGILHWVEDTYLDYCVDIPMLSDISKDNELHHYFPRAIFAYSYLENIQVTTVITFIMFLVIFILNRALLFKYPFAFATFFLIAIFSNVFHRISHFRDCENQYLIKMLQNAGILCSHKHHQLHHESSNSRYCAISEYTNYILDNIYFWRFLEWLVLVTTGIKPSRKSKYDDYRSIQNYMHENAKMECPDIPTMKDVEMLKEILREYKQCNNITA